MSGSFSASSIRRLTLQPCLAPLLPRLTHRTRLRLATQSVLRTVPAHPEYDVSTSLVPRRARQPAYNKQVTRQFEVLVEMEETGVPRNLVFAVRLLQIIYQIISWAR